MNRKYELIRKYSEGWVGGMTGGDEERIVYPAMDEYAKEIALGYQKWKKGLGIINEKNSEKYLINYAMGEWSLFANNEQELFEKYIKLLSHV